MLPNFVQYIFKNNVKFDIKLIKLLPKCVVQYMFINYLDIDTIKKVIKYYPTLFNNEHHKTMLKRINEGFIYCCKEGYFEEVKQIYNTNCWNINNIYEIIKQYGARSVLEYYTDTNYEIIKWLYLLDKSNDPKYFDKRLYIVTCFVRGEDTLESMTEIVR